MLQRSRHPGADNGGLAVRLLGEFAVYGPSDKKIGFTYRKVGALFAILCSACPREVSRAQLEAMLWPEKSEDEAGRNLRHALTMVRRILREALEKLPLFTTKKSVQLQSSASVWIDVQQFLGNVSHGEPGLAPTAPPSGIGALERALRLYAGPFMDGFELADCPTFDIWMLGQREQLCNEALAACSKLLGLYEQRQDRENALRVARRLSELQPLDESAHRALVYWTARGGDRVAALRLYESFVEELADEFGTEPSPVFRALADHLKDFKIPQLVTAPVEPPLAVDVGVPLRLVLMYVHIVGKGLDPEAAYEALAQLQGEARAEILSCDGQVIRHPFGGLVAYFHAPLSDATIIAAKTVECIHGMRRLAVGHNDCQLTLAVLTKAVEGCVPEVLELMESVGGQAYECARRQTTHRCVVDEGAAHLLAGRLAFEPLTCARDGPQLYALVPPQCEQYDGKYSP